MGVPGKDREYSWKFQDNLALFGQQRSPRLDPSETLSRL